jgi:hypothetical protein
VTSRIALIVTGELERLGLAQSLERAFPEAEFMVDSKRDSFTSGRVSILANPPIPALVDKLAAALVAAVDPGRNGARRPDRVVVVDDLEIVNLDQPEVVVEAFRQAVVRHVEGHWASETRREVARARLRESASFHLLAPMTEAYFFADAPALVAVGVKKMPVLAAGQDHEDFLVEDTGYLQPVDGAHSWARPDRAKHPKRYLQYLLDPAEVVRYRETKQGLAGLQATHWRRVVPARPPAQLRLLRSLLFDLAMGLGTDPAWIGASPHPATWQHPGGVLRNI